MASAVLDTEDERPLLPTIRGVKHFSRYGKRQRLLRQWSEGSSAEGFAQKKTAYLGEKTDFAFFALGLGEQESEEHINFHPMKNACILFQGPSAASQKSATASLSGLAEYEEGVSLGIALSYNGVCCYADVLRSPSCDPEAARLIHVLPGQIRYRDRSYDQIQHSKSKRNAATMLPPQEVAQISPASKEDVEALSSVKTPNSLKLQAIAFESSIQATLFCSYRVLMPTGSLDLCPSILMLQVLQRSGQIPCGHGPHCREDLALPCSTVLSGWAVDPEKTKNLTFLSNIACCVWPDRSDLEKCIVLTSYSIIGTNMSMNGVFLRRDECLPCCTVVLLKEAGKISAKQYAGHKIVMHIV